MDGHSSPEPSENITVDIVVTAPSSPEIKGPLTNGSLRSEYDDAPPQLTFQPSDSLSIPGDPAMSSSSNLTSFEQAMSKTAFPEPGPQYYAIRQALWRTQTRPPPSQPRTAVTRIPKLQAILQREGPLDKEEYWKGGLEKIYKGLVSGQRIKDRLPLRDLVCPPLALNDPAVLIPPQVKILQAGWIHDGTWPKGQLAPEPDDEMDVGQTAAYSTTATAPSGATTPTTAPGTPFEGGAQGWWNVPSAIAGPSR